MLLVDCHSVDGHNAQLLAYRTLPFLCQPGQYEGVFPEYSARQRYSKTFRISANSGTDNSAMVR